MSDDVIISKDLTIPLAEIELSAVRSQGAGGQNVNKVSSAIHLRFDIANSKALTDDVRERLLSLKDRRVTEDGVLVIKAQEFRTQEKNRRAAMERMRDLILSATVARKRRRKTRPSKRVKEKRLEEKRYRSSVKKSRGRISDDS